jgi:tRNA U34 2-thiouridine synthase MnmA/TrmU
MKKAISLISGGLDSMLATKLVLDEGVHVEGINFFTGFCVEGHTHAIRNKDKTKPKRNNSLWVAEQLGIKLHIIDVIEEYKEILLNPKHGYGKNMNPCLDCKTFMVAKAKEWAEKNNFDFIITGEVMGQRPMSQRRETMPIVESESGADDLLLRPLCAKHLPETLPEREGWVKRENMLDFSGRDRKPQMQLAKQYGFVDYATPAGGCCFLTDKVYSDKLVDMWQARGERKYEFDDLMMLKVGRHIRPKPHFKMIIARDEGEVKFLENYRNQYPNLYPTSHNGPLALIDGKMNDNDFELAAKILARYSQGKNENTVRIELVQNNNKYLLQVKPYKADEIKIKWFI